MQSVLVLLTRFGIEKFAVDTCCKIRKKTTRDLREYARDFKRFQAPIHLMSLSHLAIITFFFSLTIGICPFSQNQVQEDYFQNSIKINKYISNCLSNIMRLLDAYPVYSVWVSMAHLEHLKIEISSLPRSSYI